MKTYLKIYNVVCNFNISAKEVKYNFHSTGHGLIGEALKLITDVLKDTVGGAVNPELEEKISVDYSGIGFINQPMSKNFEDFKRFKIEFTEKPEKFIHAGLKLDFEILFCR